MPSELSPDLTTAIVEIAAQTFWVGERPQGEIRYTNPYLRRFEASSKDDRDFDLLVDPSSSREFEVVLAKISKVLGRIEDLDGILLNQQDPDISASVARLLADHVPDAPLLCSEDTGELVHNYHDVSEHQFVHLEDYPTGLRLPSGHVVIPISAAFGHSRGATMLYDPSSRVLFSGVVFSGLTAPDAEGLYADESDWTGIRAFHQTFVPTKAVLQQAIDRVRALEPPVEVIAPQYGRVIPAEHIETFLNRLEELPVGIDLLDGTQDSPQTLETWNILFRDLVEAATAALGKEALRRLFEKDPNLEADLHFEEDTPRITAQGKTCVERALRLLGEALDHESINRLKYQAIHAAAAHDLPTPKVDIDETRMKVIETDDSGADDSWAP